jgi:outer membrane receptor for ferrienterochelin and colicins
MKFRLKPIAAALVFLTMAQNAQAVDVAAGELDAALHGLAQETGIQILFDANEIKGARTSGVHGAANAEDALKQLLQNSGYSYQSTGTNSFVIRAASRTKEVSMKEITVTATRYERSVDEVPVSVSVLSEKELKTKNRQNVYDALRDEVGLDYSYPTSVAHQVDPTIRGVGQTFAGSTTLTLVDGMPNDTASSNLLGHGGLNFTSMQDVDRVEVLRGPASALYGYGAIGGVINVIPKRWKGDAGVEVNTAYGSHNTQQIGAAVGTAKESFDVRLSVYDAKSDGFVATPVFDGWSIDGGPRNWSDKKVALMAGFRPVDRHEITLNVQTYNTDSAIYGGRPNDRQKMDGQSATLGYRFDVSDSTNIQTRFRAAHLRQYYSFDNGDWNGLVVPGQVTAPDLPLAYYGGRTSDTTKFLVQLDTKLSDANQLIVGYGHDTGNYQTDSTMVGFPPTSYTAAKDKADALFAQDEHKFGAVTLTGGLRYDRLIFSPDTVNGVPKNGSSSTDNVVTPRLGARYHLTESTSFYASYGTAYLPAINAFKFVQPSVTRVDNPNVKPERSATYEIGMNNDLGVGKLRTSIFQTKYQDQITLGTDPITAKRQWQNIAFVTVDGVEIAYDGNLGNGWLPYTNFSYTKAQDFATTATAGTQSMRVAPRKFNLGVTYAPSSAWSATLNGRAVSGLYFNNLTPAQHSGGHFIADAKVNIALPISGGEKWNVFLAVNNIGGKKYQPYNIGEWTDGRTATIGLSGKL